jgi:tRNA pseudouridine55 synthase
MIKHSEASMVNIHGYLPIWKPSGPTSFDIVHKIRKASRIRKVGHGGTLDPLAEGILPILLGSSTKMNVELESYAKTYSAKILLGTTTDTLDLEGKIITELPVPNLTATHISNILSSFKGEVEQVPPMYSALKHNGKRLYDLARQGITVKRNARKVTIYDIRLEKIDLPFITINVVCGKGTYIRSLASDIGEILGCGATLQYLARTRYGAFSESNHVELEQVLAQLESQNYSSIMPPYFIFAHWPSISLTEGQEGKVRNGLDIEIDPKQITSPSKPHEYPFVPEPPEEKIIALDSRNTMVSILTKNGLGIWHPSRLIPKQSD